MWTLYLAAALLAFDGAITVFANTVMGEDMRRAFYRSVLESVERQNRNGWVWVWDSIGVLALAAMAIVVNSLWMWIVGGALIVHYLITAFGPRKVSKYERTIKGAVHEVIRGATLFGYSLFFILFESLPR